MTSETPRARPAHIITIGALYALIVARFWFLCDDAYITFRFARNWAQGRGLVFNPGEFPPVEGYSNFLWLVYAALLELLSAPVSVIVPLTSALAGAALLLRVHSVMRHHLGVTEVPALLATLTLALSPAIGVWATSGLATMPFALLVFLLAQAWIIDDDPDERVRSAGLAIALCLIRTEGIAWVGVIAGVSVIGRALGDRPLAPHLRRLARSAVPVAVIYGLYTGWRYGYYGTLIPNTALAKVEFGPRLLARGLKYVSLFWLTTLIPLLSLLPALLLVRGERRGLWIPLTLLALGFPAYGVVVGGDFMPFGRLLVPGLPFAALLLGGGLQELLRRRGEPRWIWATGVALVLIGAMPIVDLHLVPLRLRELVHFRLSDKDFLSETSRWANQRDNTEGFTHRGLALAQIADPGDTVVAAAVGAVGYFSDLEVLDQHGLVTKEVAYRPIPSGPLTTSPGHDKHVEPEFFVKYEPRFLFARAVEGKLAAGRMKDTLEQWQIDRSVMDRYVPDFYEVFLPNQEKRSFLLVVRRLEPGEDPAALWNQFAARRRELNAELRAQYADDPDRKTDGSG
ncbi:MAG TPA: hypothetical protein ENK18_02330 [Deltaproteobacteria bacterium]|nr:hypothetical protein [Deltaproteobacteria bacterium]